MTNETKQPTLPEVLKKVREVFDRLKEYAVASDDCQYGTLSTSLVKDMADQSLALLDSVQVTSEPVAVICDGWQIMFVGSEPIIHVVNRHGLKIGDVLYGHAKPCTRCAELEKQFKQTTYAFCDESGSKDDKLAALEEEAKFNFEQYQDVGRLLHDACEKSERLEAENAKKNAALKKLQKALSREDWAGDERMLDIISIAIGESK